MLTQNRTSPIVAILVVFFVFMFHAQSAFAVVESIPIEGRNIQKDHESTVKKREQRKVEKLERKVKRITEKSKKKGLHSVLLD